MRAMSVIVVGVAMGSGAIQARPAQADCSDLPSHADLRQMLQTVVDGGGNAGVGNQVWGTIVDREGVVCAVAFSGDDRGDQAPGSRMLSAQKAYTANAFSLPRHVGALSSGNLYGMVLEQGSLFGLQFSNSADTGVAYGDQGITGSVTDTYGQTNDPMVGKVIGGVNVLGGGLPLYEKEGIVGGLGVSGDTPCTDHIIAWKVRDAFELDYVPRGVSATKDDNLIIATPVTPNTFAHPTCPVGDDPIPIIRALPDDFPIGPNS